MLGVEHMVHGGCDAGANLRYVMGISSDDAGHNQTATGRDGISHAVEDGVSNIAYATHGFIAPEHDIWVPFRLATDAFDGFGIDRGGSQRRRLSVSGNAAIRGESAMGGARTRTIRSRVVRGMPRSRRQQERRR